MDTDTSMTGTPTRSGAEPGSKSRAQWLILVFWAAVVVAWAWFVSAFAAIATGEEDPAAIVLWVVALAPAAVVVWRYPTDRLFRAVLALVAFGVPAYLAADSLIRLLRG